MGDAAAVRRRRYFSISVAMALMALSVALGTKSFQSIFVVIFPGMVLCWAVSNEYRLSRDEPPQAAVPAWTKVRLFVIYPACSLILLITLAGRIWGADNLRTLWIIESVSFGLMLCKVYLRFCVVRERSQRQPAPSRDVSL
jgi:Transmembrane secretion effector